MNFIAEHDSKLKKTDLQSSVGLPKQQNPEDNDDHRAFSFWTISILCKDANINHDVKSSRLIRMQGLIDENGEQTNFHYFIQFQHYPHFSYFWHDLFFSWSILWTLTCQVTFGYDNFETLHRQMFHVFFCNNVFCKTVT